MWEVISDIVTKREKCSLILTTHSMEECEALCTRIGIMVGGTLRCLGSSQRLRSLYGLGFQIEMGLAIPGTAAVEEEMKSIMSALDQGSDVVVEASLNRSALLTAFTARQQNGWAARLDPQHSGADLQASLDNGGSVSLRHFACEFCLSPCSFFTFSLC
jgi:ATP-binding cassette, subfamily A (ABC1), member 3